MTARPYQQDAEDKVFQCLKENASTLVVMPTGTGKTHLFGSIASKWDKGRVMVMAHRDELIRQAVNKVGKIVGEQCEIEMADEYADMGSLYRRSRVVVTSVQTMCRPRRHTRFNPDHFGLLVIDEAHHAVSPSYRGVIDYFSQNKNLKILGVTATPDRTDEEALGKVFQSVAYDYQLNQAIDDGWLVPIDQRYAFVEGLDFSSCRTTAGDLNGADLEHVMLEESMLHKVVDPTMTLAGDRKTLVFASSVAHADRMCEIANRHRQNCAAFIHGGTPSEERRDILRRYSAGEFQFLFNCAIATEGFDEPTIGCVAVARPTKSRSLYCQIVGRGTRTLAGVVDGVAAAADRRTAIATSGKQNVLVIDFVGNSGRHKLITTADILGGNYSEEVVEKATESAKKKSKAGLDAHMLEELKAAQQAFEEAERRRRQRLIAKANFGTRSVDPFSVLDITPTREPGWHKGKKPSEGQLRALRNFKIPESDIASLSFSQASQLIDASIKRIDEKKCSYKQAKKLQEHGFDPNTDMATAGRIMGALAQNNWRPLSEKQRMSLTSTATPVMAQVPQTASAVHDDFF